MRSAPTVLLTGFEPFGGDPVNSSWEVAKALHAAEIDGLPVRAVQLPCRFGSALAVLHEALLRQPTALVLALGQACNRRAFSIERVAVNLIDARIPDNAGSQPVDVRIVDNAANAYFSTLPIKAMLQRLHKAKIPAALSQTAGTFVCNQVFFGLQHALRRRHGVRGGFVHVPYLPEQAAQHAAAPSLPLETMIAAIRLCLEVALATTGDAHYAAGALD